MKITQSQLREMIKQQLDERCQKGYKTHPTRKTKKMFGRTYRNCVKAESVVNEQDPDDRSMSIKAQKELADDMEFLLEKLLSPKMQEVLYKYMHSAFLVDLQDKVHKFKMHAYSRPVGPPMGEHKEPVITERAAIPMEDIMRAEMIIKKHLDEMFEEIGTEDLPENFSTEILVEPIVQKYISGRRSNRKPRFDKLTGRMLRRSIKP